MKIYTKTGDKGDTSLIGGRRVSKAEEQIEAYGTIDELIAYVGYLRDMLENEHQRTILLTIQDRLMVIAAMLSNDIRNPSQLVPIIRASDIQLLEQEIDIMEQTITPLTAFILPGGHPSVSLCHVVRTVCRRAERIVVRLAFNLHVENLVIQYLNRLSDYFFILARKIAKDLNVTEIEWHAKL